MSYYRKTEHNKLDYDAILERMLKMSDDVMPCSPVVESANEIQTTEDSVPANVCTELTDNNVGAEWAVVVGCNANNDNASARTVNGNNAVSNGNDNYAGRFSLPVEENLNFGRTCTTCSARTKNTEEITHQTFEETMALLQCEYSGNNTASESNANASHKGGEKTIWDELKEANSKRHLKNLKRFLTDRTIVTAAVERCLKKAASSPQRTRALKRKDKIIDDIIKDMTDETYEVQHITKRVIKKRGKGDKNRNADIFSIYDRCVQNLLLLVIGEKLKNKLTRNVYSGITGRSTLSNDRRFCLIDRVHDYCVKHPDDYVMMTDIRHFYESLKSEIVLGVLFETVYDRYTRILLSKTLLCLPNLPIGGTLSQVCAMLVLDECDRYIISHFKPTIYCIFGDNRFFGDKDKQKLIKIREYQNIWYKARLGLDMKKDYSLHKVKDGFRLCKTDYNDKYVKIRAEMRRRAIRGAIRGQQHYAGYKGFLMKSDSKRLKFLIENMLPSLRKGIKIINREFTPELKKIIDRVMAENIDKSEELKGEKLNLAALIDHKVCITKFKRNESKKETGNDHFFSFELAVPVLKKDNETSIDIYRSWNGSADILYFFERVEKGIIKLPVYTEVRKEGNSFYFEGYHDYVKDYTKEIIDKYGITFNPDDYKKMGLNK